MWYQSLLTICFSTMLCMKRHLRQIVVSLYDNGRRITINATIEWKEILI